jgi:hypothetical protein
MRAALFLLAITAFGQTAPANFTNAKLGDEKLQRKSGY